MAVTPVTLQVDDSQSIFGAMGDGLTAIITGDPVSGSQLRWATVAVGAGAAVIGGMIARKRTENGQSAYFGILF